VVWQITSFHGFALLALALIWLRAFAHPTALPFRRPLAGRCDVNVTAFAALLLILVGGIVSVAHAAVGG
jgi:hypothetical protein